MTLTLTKDEVRKILDGEYVKGDFEKHYRHNGGYQDVIFTRDGKHYQFTYLWFEDEGVYWDNTYEATEVVEAERVVKYWKKVE
jgi:hypothetical protein